MTEEDKSVTIQELKKYIADRQRAFTKQVEQKAEKAGVQLDVKVMVTVMPMEESKHGDC